MRKNKRLEKYGISQDRHMELRYFCKQYIHKKAQLKAMTYLQGINYTGMPVVNEKSSVTENKAIKAVQLENDIEIIEQSAKMANSSICKAIIDNVTLGIDYFYLNVPCSRNYFYKAVEDFYIILDKKKF